jgi:hypothetical protein
MSNLGVFSEAYIGVPAGVVQSKILVGEYVAPILNVNTGVGVSTTASPPNPIWQSFTMPAAGQLFRAEWDFAVLPPNGGYTARIYLGNGIGGSLLASVPVSANGSGSPYIASIDFSSVAPALLNATQYTIELVPNSGTINYSLSTLTGYSGGQSNLGGATDYPIRIYTGSVSNYFIIDPSGNASFLKTVAASISGNAATATLAATATVANGVAANSVSNAGLAQMAANTVKANITGGVENSSDVDLASFKGWLGLGTIGNNQIAFGNGSAILSGDPDFTFETLGTTTPTKTLIVTKGCINFGPVITLAGNQKQVALFDPNTRSTPDNKIQFTGLGIENDGTFVHSLYQTSASYKWYAATSTTTQNLISSLSGVGLFTANKGAFSGIKGLQINGSSPSVGVGANAEIGEATTIDQFAENAVAGDMVIRTGVGQTLRLLAGSGTSVLDILTASANLNLPISFAQTLAGTPVAGAVKTLFEYDELYVHATALSGALAVASFNAAYIFRKNNMVRVILSPWGGANATASVTETFTTVLPARFRPVSQVEDVCSVTRNATRTGKVRVATSGAITFFGDDVGGNFNNGQACAFGGGKPLEYSIN